MKKVTVLKGDGIGKEVMDAAVEVLKAVGRRYYKTFELSFGAIGGEAVDQYGDPLPQETIRMCEASDAVLLGAVGGPKWDHLSSDKRPEAGLLKIRKHFNLSVNLRPIKTYPTLLAASPLKEEFANKVDFVIVRELTGGLYFGQPSYHSSEQAVDTLTYSRKEIKRVVEYAFQLAERRRGKVTSVDKANVLESSKLWRDVVNEVKENYPKVEVEHLLVDAAAMKLITSPSSFDVIVTENMFGDILSDEASVITGSLGMLPSASLSDQSFGLYEPVHGSAPDLEGKNCANPLAAILSVAMMLKYSLNMEAAGRAVERAVYTVLEDGYCTGEFKQSNKYVLTTKDMARKVVEELEREMVTDHIMAAYA